MNRREGERGNLDDESKMGREERGVGGGGGGARRERAE